MVWIGTECGKNQGNENLKATIPCTDYARSRRSGECGIFQLFGQQGVTYEIKYRIAMAKAAFNYKRTLFTSKLNLNFRKKLVNVTWIIALYGAETWTLKVDQRKLESFELW